MQDTFSAVEGVEKLGVPSGWDVDKRGGLITGSGNNRVQIVDNDENYPVSMTKELMTHKSGKITMSTAFSMTTKAESGFSYTLSGQDKIAFKIVTEKDNLCILKPDGTTQSITKYEKGKIIPLNVTLDYDKKTYEVVMGDKHLVSYPFAQDATQLDRITLSTSEKETMIVLLRYIYIYLNYAVNETFMSVNEGSLPYGWEKENGGVSTAVAFDGNQVYPDLFSLVLDDPTSVDNSKVTKTFEDKTGKIVFSARYIVDRKRSDASISIGNGKTKAVSVKMDSSDILTGNGTVVRANYRDNLWYILKIVADIPAQKADIYLNYQKVLSDVPFENKVASLNTLCFETRIKSSVVMKIFNRSRRI